MGEMVDVALKLRHELDSRAAEVDREGRFPHENYERMLELGYLRGPVPGALGGLDADLAETARAQRALSWGCGSTAVAVNMHLFQVGGAADGWRTSGANEPPLRRVVEDGIVLASTGAEAVVAGEWSTTTTAERDGDGYVLTGRKFFCSQADAMDVVRVNARDVDTGDILVVAIPASAPGVEVVETWDTMGMRASASHDLVLDGVRVPETAVSVRLPADGPAWHPAFANVIRWFLTLVTGVYVGIADRAREAAFESIGTGRNSTFRDPALTDALVGELEAAHFRAGAILEHGLTTLGTTDDPLAGMATAITVKQEATDAAVAVVEHAVELAGGRSYFRKSVLERLARDVRAARYHPPSAPVSHQMIGIQAQRARQLPG